MNLDHLIERHYCPLHPELYQPGGERCVKCHVPLRADPTASGALRQVMQRPAVLYIILAVMCALMLAIPLVAR